MIPLDDTIIFICSQLVIFFNFLKDTHISAFGLSISLFDAIISYFVLFFILALFLGFSGGDD